MCAYTPVEKYEADFEYNPDWGGPAPALWLPAAWQPNCGNDKVFNLSPYCQQPGTWFGSTAQRNVVSERGRAFLFNGTDDYLDTTLTDPTLFSGDFTIAGWAREATSNSDIILLDKRSANNNGVIFWLDNREIKLQIDGVDLEVVVAFDVGAWCHFAGTRRGDVTKIFFNGVEVDTGITALDGSTATPIRLGADSTGGAVPVFYSACRIGDLYVSDHALTSSQIPLLYKSSLDGPGVMAQPIQPRWFPAAVAGGYTVPLQLILECAQ